MGRESKKSNDRLSEGALSPLNTPRKPPAPAKLVPLVPSKPSNEKNKD